MRELTRLLLVAGASGQRGPALERSAQIAVAAGAAVHICLFDHSLAIAAATSIDPPGGDKARERFMDERRMWVNSQALRLRERGIRVKWITGWSTDPARDVVDYASNINAGLIIKDVGVSSTLDRLAHRSFDGGLLRLSPVPLMLVVSASPAPLERVIAAVDVGEHGLHGDALNLDIIRSARRLAHVVNADLHIAHSFHHLPVTAPQRAQYAARFEALARLENVASTHAHFLQGEPSEALAKLANRSDTDLLVIGAGRPLDLQRFVMGRTAGRICDAALCDVLAVKAGGAFE